MPIDTLCCFYGGLTYVVGVKVKLKLSCEFNISEEDVRGEVV